MEVFDAIEARHSYRDDFRETTIPRKDLQKIVQAGIQAPSGCNAQTTTFVIVDKPELVKAIGEIPSANKAVRAARAFIACVTDKQPTPVYKTMSFQVEDCAAAVENMLLAVTALGYATVWIDGWLRAENRSETVNSLLGLPESKTVRILLPLGIPTEKKRQKEKLPFEQRACFNRYSL